MTTTDAGQQSQGWIADDSSFGARLALVRQRMGWGNVKLAAEQCGLPVQSWRTWERDGVMPRNIIEIAEAISAKTGCDFSWLLMGPRLREGRIITTAGTGPAHNHGSGRPAKRARDKRSPVRSRPIGLTRTGNSAPTPTGPPTQRRATLVNHRPGN